MARVALLSNPRSTGNRALLPQVRSFCAAHKDIFHYEVEDVDQIGTALRTIALIEPRVLVINGGDGTVQAALTEIYNGRHFGDNPPPVAVLPNGKTNLIAYDLGAGADALETLERVLAIARTDLAPHIVQRELITLSGGAGNGKPVLGMFLGGAYLADTMLYCRNKLYPLGLPNGLLADATGLWVVTWQGALYHVSTDGKQDTPLKAPGAQLDGVIQTLDGQVVFSSWEKSALYVGTPDTQFAPLLSDVKEPADIGYDSKRGQVLVPQFTDNTVQIVKLPAAAAAAETGAVPEASANAEAKK